MSNLVQNFQEYSGWRKEVATAIEAYRNWIANLTSLIIFWINASFV